MAEADAVITDTLALIFRGIRSIHWAWFLSWLGRILIFPIKLMLLPVTFVGRILLVVLSPALYVFSYIGSSVKAIIDYIASFEPLYTLFGSAAVIGIIAGIALGVFSTFLTSQLGMHRDPLEELEDWKGEDALDMASVQDESSSNEAEWQWLERSPSRRRPASGLLSQTIHEEEDDNDSDAAF
ncbi:hypothetical protein HJFPF1_06740 [Paramyrothecium foliicola]|nr:hypothetical protein HJFPF1_06740 [Paramyrothecium foliicola]